MQIKTAPTLANILVCAIQANQRRSVGVKKDLEKLTNKKAIQTLVKNPMTAHSMEKNHWKNIKRRGKKGNYKQSKKAGPPGKGTPLCFKRQTSRITIYPVTLKPRY